MIRKDLHEENRRSWNVATEAHNSHKDDQARFLRDGGETVFPEELALLGDISGARLLHLQCNAGQDTLSLARHGAIVTGVDISDTAIAFARRLSADSGIPGTFERADIFDWLALAAARRERFDVVFSSYGVIIWLSDLRQWAEGISAVLAPGGRFVLLELHPFAMMFDEHWELGYPYFGRGGPETYEEGIGDYVASSGPALTPSGYVEGVVDFRNPHRVHEFPWGISDVITALLDAGLVLATFREYPYVNGDRPFAEMRELPGRRWATPEGKPEVPLMYGLVARRP